MLYCTVVHTTLSKSLYVGDAKFPLVKSRCLFRQQPMPFSTTSKALNQVVDVVVVYRTKMLAVTGITGSEHGNSFFV